MKHIALVVLLTTAGLASCTKPGSGPIPITPSQGNLDQVFLTTTQPETQPTSLPATGPADIAASEVVAASVLQVNSTFITVDDVLQRKRVELKDLPNSIPQTVFRQQALGLVREGIRELVQQALIYGTASERLAEEQTTQIDTEVAQARQEMLNRVGGSIAKLQDELARENLTLDKALQEHRKKLIIEMYLRDKFQPSIYISRKMMWDYYQAHTAEFTAPKRVQMQMIVVDPRTLVASDLGKPTQAELDKARPLAKRRIDDAAAELKKGTAFDEVARKYSTDSRASEGGLWPMMQQGSHRRAKAEAVAFAMPQGQTSGVIEDNDCFVIVKAAKVEPGGKTSFEDAQVKIEDKLRREQYKKLQDEFYQKLQKSAIIDESKDFVERCVDRAVLKYWGK